MSDSTTLNSNTTNSSHPNNKNINDKIPLIQQISESDENPCNDREEFSRSSQDEKENIYDLNFEG
jgi:hypothetical protein